MVKLGTQMAPDVELLVATHEAVVKAIRGAIYPPGRRVQMQVAYCYLVIQHQCAIAHLLDVKMTGPAFALARPTFEALVKGLWLSRCATDEQLERHAQGKELDKLGDLVESLLDVDLPLVITRSLHQVKSKYWKGLSSLTHMGHNQVRHWLSPNGVEADYPAAALHELANFASFMSLVAGRELALRGNNSEGVVLLTNMLPEAPSE